MRLLLPITIVAAALAVLPAAALTTTSWSSWSTYGPAQLEWTGASLDLEQWDPLTGVSWDPASWGGGTLVGAEIELYGALDNENSWTLTNGTNQTITMYQRATITLLPPGGGLPLITVIPEQTDIWTSQTAPPTKNGTQILSNSDTDSASISGAALVPFVGTGNVTVDLGSADFHYGTSSGGGGATFQSIFNPHALAEARIRYTYTEDIPEPGTFALMGLGLLGVAAVIRRRRREED